MFINCPKCSAQIPDNMKFCTNCGTKLKHASKSQKVGKDIFGFKCPYCSAKISSNSKFCRKCGKQLEINEKNEINPKDDLIEGLKYLEKLSELKEKGIISTREFEDKKKEILKLTTSNP